MNIKRLDHLNMTVNNFHESAEWYQRVFGFKIVEEGTDDGRPWGILRAGNAMLCIYEHPNLDSPNRHSRKEHGLSHFALTIDDPEAWRKVVSEQKIPLNWGGEVKWPNSTAWYISDPTGYEIEVAHWNDGVRFD